MKRITKILGAFLLVFTVCACSGETEIKPLNISLKKENKLSETIAYQITSIDQVDKITPDIIGTTYTYYKPKEETNKFLKIETIINNLTDEELDLSKSIKGAFVIGETEYSAALGTVGDDGTTLNQGGTIPGKASKKVYLYAEIKPNLLKKQITFNLTVKEKVATLEFKLAKVKIDHEVKNLNDVLSFASKAEVTLQAVNVAKEVAPATPSGLYSFFKVKDQANSFIVLTTSFQNISGSDAVIASGPFARLIASDGNAYPATVLYEKDNRSSLTNATTVTLSNGQSGIVHYAFEVPDTLLEGSKKIQISYLNQIYEVNI